MMCVTYTLVAQLDRVQVSEACGVGSSPAERTIFLFYPILFSSKVIKNKQLTHSCYPTLSDWVLALRYSLRYFLR